jgi:ribosome-interacting GTPase 1
MQSVAVHQYKLYGALLQVCAYHEWNLDGLVEMVWEYLDLVR